MTEHENYIEQPSPAPGMRFSFAFIFGVCYSTVFAAAMSSGLKFLHPETPTTHGALQSFAWALGSGFGVAAASNVSRIHRFAVGIAVTLVISSVWAGLLFFLREHLDVPVDQQFFKHNISLQSYLVGFALLIFLIGLLSTWWGSTATKDATPISSIPHIHLLWLWLPAFAWVSVLPIMGYYIWLQFATSLYSLVHPSLWFRVGSSLLIGTVGIGIVLKGIEISLRAVSDKHSYGGAVWKRVLAFVAATLILVSVVGPLLINLDIDGMKHIPASLSDHPWWLL